ncbi:MAG TPA: pyridoxine 5'-phosphate synthase, partial [Syntrophorhabdaceae bacterium]|nr:pyridoxine 5'-phosphate synthase [Syntrophorhabdaceae bacterium]
ADRLKRVVERVKQKGIKVSMFVDPEEKQIKASKEIGAHMIEIHTGRYCDATTDGQREKEFEHVVKAAKIGKALGLGVNAGHGLHYHNVRRIALIPEIDELSIGHSIIARAVFVGLDRAVRDMLQLIK